MKMALNEVLEYGKKGQWAKAWEIAQLDEGLHRSVTKENWIKWAKEVLVKLLIKSFIK